MIKIIFILLLLPINNLWGDDIWFILPTDKQPVTGVMEIKIYPLGSSINVNVWIESDYTDEVVWMGQLIAEYNYSIKVDTTRFKLGKYEINAEYSLYDEEYDGGIGI